MQNADAAFLPEMKQAELINTDNISLLQKLRLIEPVQAETGLVILNYFLREPHSDNEVFLSQGSY
jgi:hypothetical protein